MGLEIERKFLVKIDKLPELSEGKEIQQGYISSEGAAVIRIRIMAEKAFLTIKSNSPGLSRLEFEYAIPMNDAKDMIQQLCKGKYIKKKRYTLQVAKHTWEIDVFEDENKGLIIAEIELETESESFELPDWIEKEVTSEKKYYNANLMKSPYLQWK
ncbi:MAG: CYTH domain-containing protein [Leptospiraceae bacterium]|nr:CYTH domain-containing protein [Leptospiraceae bacterium]